MSARNTTLDKIQEGGRAIQSVQIKFALTESRVTVFGIYQGKPKRRVVTPSSRLVWIYPELKMMAENRKSRRRRIRERSPFTSRGVPELNLRGSAPFPPSPFPILYPHPLSPPSPFCSLPSSHLPSHRSPYPSPLNSDRDLG